MKKVFKITLVSILFLAVIIIGVIIIYILQNKEKVEVADNTNNINTETNIDEVGYDAYSKIAKEDIISDGGPIIDYIRDISDNNVNYNESNYIIIGKVQTIDGGINYNPKEKVYTVPETIGKVKVERVLKGQLDEKVIPYIRYGGIITAAEYQLSLFPSEYSSKNHFLNTLTEEEKNHKYINERAMGDIDIEQGKTYLMYLIYAEDYERYAISFVQYGLREVDVTTLGSDNKTIKVKNNDTGEWEMLDTIIPNM